MTDRPDADDKGAPRRDVRRGRPDRPERPDRTRPVPDAEAEAVTPRALRQGGPSRKLGRALPRVGDNTASVTDESPDRSAVDPFRFGDARLVPQRDGADDDAVDDAPEIDDAAPADPPTADPPTADPSAADPAGDVPVEDVPVDDSFGFGGARLVSRRDDRPPAAPPVGDGGFVPEYTTIDSTPRAGSASTAAALTALSALLARFDDGADAPADTPADKLAEEPAQDLEEPTTTTIEEPVDEPVEEHVEAAVQHDVQELVEEPVDEPVEESIEDTVQELVEEPVEVPAEARDEAPTPGSPGADAAAPDTGGLPSSTIGAIDRQLAELAEQLDLPLTADPVGGEDTPDDVVATEDDPVVEPVTADVVAVEEAEVEAEQVDDHDLPVQDTDDVAADDAMVEDATAEPVTIEDVTIEDVTAEPVTIEDDAVEDVTVEDVTVEDVTVEDVTVEDVSVEDVSVEDVSVEDVSVEDVSVEDVTAEPVTVEPVTVEDEPAEPVAADEPVGHDDPEIDDTVEAAPPSPSSIVSDSLTPSQRVALDRELRNRLGPAVNDPQQVAAVAATLPPTIPARAKAPKPTKQKQPKPTVKKLTRWDRPAPPRDWRYFVGMVGRTLIVTGLLMFGFVAYQLWGTGIATARAQNDLASQFEELVAENTGSTAPAATDPPPATDPVTSEPVTTEPATTDAGAPAPTPTIAPGDAVVQDLPEIVPGQALARLEIPRMGKTGGDSLIVVPGVDPESLKKGPGHYPDTPLPGQLGNAAIAGHRTTWGEPFARIDELVAGDEIIVTMVSGDRFVYEVASTEIVGPDDYYVVTTTDPTVAELTLTSCHPRFSARQRIAVHAFLKAEESDPVGLPTFYDIEANTAPSGDDDPTVTVPDSVVGGADTTDASVPATTVPTSVPSSVPAVVPGAPGSGPDALTAGWFHDSAAWPHIGAWGFICAAIAVAAYFLSKRFRNYAIGWSVMILPFVVCLYFLYENINRLLPPGL